MRSDDFDISPMAEQLARRICANLDGHKASREAFVASVYSEWGGGKTHCLKGVEAWFLKRPQGLSENAQPKDGDALVIPVFFSPWMFEREPHLVIPLFNTIEAKLHERLRPPAGQDGSPTELAPQTSGWLQKLGRLRRALTGKLENTLKVDWLSVLKTVMIGAGFGAGIPAVEMSLKLIGGEDAAVKLGTQASNGEGEAANAAAAQTVDSGADELHSLYYNFRHNLNQLIETPVSHEGVERRLRLVVLVDDLDRCLPEKSIEMLEAIKLFLNVDGFSFMLAVDDDIVERGIRHRYADYLRHPDAKESSGETAVAKAPITGHEYLEKIVHLPQHLSRWDEARCDRLLDGFTQFKTDNDDGKMLRKLVKRVVPAVPRKLIRLAEALEFQQQSIDHQSDSKEKSAAAGYWSSLTAARTLILAQLYPTVYRRLRQGDIVAFWRMLFSVERLPCGQVGFSNLLQVELHKALQAKRKSPEVLDGVLGAETEPKRAGSKKAADGEASAEATEPPPELVRWRMDELQQVLKGVSVSSKDKEAQKRLGQLRQWLGMERDGDKDEAWPPERYFTAVQLNDFLVVVREACDSRNGDGLLQLWGQERNEKAKDVAGKETEGEQVTALLRGVRAPEYQSIYLDLEPPRLRAETKSQEATATESVSEGEQEEQAAQQNVVAKAQQPTSDPDVAKLAAKPADKAPIADVAEEAAKEGSVAKLAQAVEMPPLADAPEKEVKGVKDWVAAILGGRREVENYQVEYDRRGEAADDDAFAALLDNFCQLTAVERQKLCDAAWRQRVEPLMSRQQLDYLLQLVPVGWRGAGERFVAMEAGGEQCIKDHATGWLWRADAGEDLDFEQAKALAKKVGKGWDLPTPRQLQSLVDYSRRMPAVHGGDERGAPFTDTQSDGCWASSSPVAEGAGLAWIINFDHGVVDHYVRVVHGGHRVRLVRGASRSVIDTCLLNEQGGEHGGA